MRTTTSALLFLSMICASGCAASQADLKTRAAFDLHCDQGKLELVELPEYSAGVRGCGKQATYVQRCANGSCEWVMNNAARSAN